MRRLLNKWRPSLWFVTGGALAGVLGASMLGLVVFRYLGEGIGFKIAAAMVSLAIGAVTLIIWLLLLRLLLRPLADLSRYAEAVKNREQTDLPQHFGTREMFKMGSRIVEMSEAFQNRAATIRSFTDHVTHELKTPVSVLRASAELLEEAEGLGAEDQVLLKQIQSASQKITFQLDALRGIAAAREARYLGQCSLGYLRNQLEALAGDAKVSIEGGEIAFPMSEQGMMLVLGHLIANAEMHGAGEVALRAIEKNEELVLAVSNDGKPISTGNEGHLFEPFFTTRRETGGTGMGLAIVSAILEAHKGRIALASRDPVCFEIRF